MESRLARNPEFKEFNTEHKYEVQDEYKIQLQYDNFFANEAFKRVLPKGVEIPGGFETIGTIAHLNLNET